MPGQDIAGRPGRPPGQGGDGPRHRNRSTEAMIEDRFRRHRHAEIILQSMPWLRRHPRLNSSPPPAATWLPSIPRHRPRRRRASRPRSPRLGPRHRHPTRPRRYYADAGPALATWPPRSPSAPTRPRAPITTPRDPEAKPTPKPSSPGPPTLQRPWAMLRDHAVMKTQRRPRRLRQRH